MDRDFKLFYYVLVAGENQIIPLGNNAYEMKWRITKGSLISAGIIVFVIDDNDFRILRGLDTFRWHVSKHVRV